MRATDDAFQDASLARSYSKAATFNPGDGNKMWIAGGWDINGWPVNALNDVWYSEDGITWTCATTNAAFPGRASHTLIGYDDKLWIIAGNDPGNRMDVWSSTNGVSWEEEGNLPIARNAHTCVLFDAGDGEKMWVIGGTGDLSNVLYSSDGETWTQATNEAFPYRSFHSSVVYDNKIWIMGGTGGEGTLSDVWNSEDGVTWTQVTTNAACGPRNSHTSVALDNKMWIIGGSIDGWSPIDIWYSTDGINWTGIQSSADFSSRVQHGTVTFNNKMWVLTGDVGGVGQDDVWYSPPD